MEQSEYDTLYTYLSKGVYPSNYDANKKRMLRRKAENFRIDNGELFYVGRKKGDKSRRVIKTEEERRRILENCHGQTEGKFLLFLYDANAASVFFAWIALFGNMFSSKTTYE